MGERSRKLPSIDRASFFTVLLKSLLGPARWDCLSGKAIRRFYDAVKQTGIQGLINEQDQPRLIMATPYPVRSPWGLELRRPLDRGSSKARQFLEGRGRTVSSKDRKVV